MVERAWVSNECGTLLHMHWVLSTATTLVHGVCLPYLPSLLRKLRHHYCGCSTAPRICDSMVLLQNTSLTKEEGTWDNKIMTNSFLKRFQPITSRHVHFGKKINLRPIWPACSSIGFVIGDFRMSYQFRFFLRNFVLLTGSTCGGVAVKSSMIIQQRVKLMCLDLLWPRWAGFHLLTLSIWYLLWFGFVKYLSRICSQQIWYINIYISALRLQWEFIIEKLVLAILIDVF